MRRRRDVAFRSHRGRNVAGRTRRRCDVAFWSQARPDQERSQRRRSDVAAETCLVREAETRRNKNI